MANKHPAKTGRKSPTDADTTPANKHGAAATMSPAVFDNSLSALFQGTDDRGRMKFGNYSQKEYGLVAPRMGLSLYEKMFLKKNMNRVAVEAAILAKSKKVTSFNSNGMLKGGEITTSGNFLTPKPSYPNLSYHLLANQYAHTPLSYCRPIFFDEGRTYPNKSEQERFRRVASEFATLRGKLLETPEKSHLLALAFIEKHFGNDEISFGERELERFVEFAKLERPPISPRETIFHVVLKGLYGGTGCTVPATETQPGEFAGKRRYRKEELRIKDIIEQYKRNTLGNTIEWETKKARVNMKSIPKINTQTKLLNSVLGGMLEKSVGDTKNQLRKLGMGSLKKSEVDAVERTKSLIEKNKLVLEKVLHERLIKRLKRRENRAKLRAKNIERSKTDIKDGIKKV